MTLQKLTQDKADQMINDQKKLLDLEETKCVAGRKLSEFQKNNRGHLYKNTDLDKQHSKLHLDFISAFNKWKKFRKSE
jgi:hypothetical protein